ncbi:hypothetical protein HI914_03542 [Erysiphe necator]|nr:hypothetical protein HI914_03542 [Erysiphe necator]
MRDLRGQALESKKTISRKAQLRESVRTSHGLNLRSNPRGDPRHGIDSKSNGSDHGDLTEVAVNDRKSLDSSVKNSDSWILEIEDLLEEIKEKKRSSTKGREKALSRYANILMNHYAFEQIAGKSREIFPALLKSIKGENSEKEASNALLGL